MSNLLNKSFGFVYVMSINLNMDIVKIGYTCRSPEERVIELNSQTGVFFEYKVEHKKLVSEPACYERLVHKLLKNKRVKKNKEHFNLSVVEAVYYIEHADYLHDKQVKAEALSALKKQLKSRRKKTKREIKSCEWTSTGSHKKRDIFN